MKKGFSGNKPSTSILFITLKHIFFLNLASTFLLFLLFSVFCTKNVEKADFDQRLECEAPKCWSNYTTKNHAEIEAAKPNPSNRTGPSGP